MEDSDCRASARESGGRTAPPARARPLKETRIYDTDGEHVGDVYAHDDILDPGRRVYLVLLEDDPGG